MKNLYFILMFILLLSNLIFAGNDGGQPGAFIRLGIGANAIGMGKSYTAISEDASSLYWNPGASSLTEKRQITAMVSQPFSDFDDISYNYLGYIQPVDLGYNAGIGIGIIYLNADNITKINNQMQKLGSFSNKEYALIGNYSWEMITGLSMGLNLKYVHHEIDTVDDSLFAFDIGSKYLVNDAFKMGIVLENIYSGKKKLDTEKEKLPLTFRIGLGYNIIPEWIVSTDIVYMERSDIDFSLGTEVLFYKKLFLRSGYTDATEEFSLGAGFDINPVKVDYSFTTHSDLGDSHRFSVNYMF